MERRDNEDPHNDEPITDSVNNDPTLAIEHKERLLPERKNPRKDNELPNCTNPKTDVLLPKRTTLLTLSELEN
jgi:hypothetical protein